MTMLKRDYQEAGRQAAIEFHTTGSLFKARWFEAGDKRSWQARAYNEGWELVKPEEIKLIQRPRCPGKRSPLNLMQLPKGSQGHAADLITVDEAAAFTKQDWDDLKPPKDPPALDGWPTAAKEHFQELRRMLAQESYNPRRLRLKRSIDRLIARHEP